MENVFKDKVALITGATSGIGLAIAKEFVQQGANVVITGRKQEHVDKAIATIGSKSTGFKADVSSLTQMEKLYQYIKRQHEKIDIVVANAGVGDNAPLGTITEKQFDKIIGTNLKGVLFTVQPALSLLPKGGSIVIIGSTASIDPPPSMSLYGATKAGLRMLVRGWIKDIKPSGIRINILSPGAVNTPSLRIALEADKDDSKIKALEERSPLGRIGEPEEIAEAVMFLASDAASYINGVELFADGGLTV